MAEAQISEEEKQRVKDARTKEILQLEKKTANIREALKKRPGDKYLSARFEELQGRLQQLKTLNDNGIVGPRTLRRRHDNSHFRDYGLA
ncbi:MAG: hypothetical protein G01um10142_68 [Parcubacteria group bacterium Gr01-1014_2]|nr:MAG: hypothetical protein G01um10142_68 [Parcubacteria group bacterium Gr01-1014_2]